MSCYQIIPADANHNFTLIVIRHGEGLMNSGQVMEEITDNDYLVSITDASYPEVQVQH